MSAGGRGRPPLRNGRGLCRRGRRPRRPARSIPYPSGDPVRRTGSPFFVGMGKPLPAAAFVPDCASGHAGRRGRRPLRKRNRGRAARWREGKAPPLRRRRYRGAGCTAGRRGRRPLRKRNRGRVARWREGQAPPLRRRMYRGAGRTAGHDVSAFGAPCAGARQRDVEDAVPYGSETVGRLRDGGRGKPLPCGGRMNAGAGTGDTSSAPVCALGHLPLKGKASGTSRAPSPRIRRREAGARPGRRGAKGEGTRGAKGKSRSCRKRKICSCGAKSPCNIPPRRYNKEWETEYTEGEIRSHG